MADDFEYADAEELYAEDGSEAAGRESADPYARGAAAFAAAQTDDLGEAYRRGAADMAAQLRAGGRPVIDPEYGDPDEAFVLEEGDGRSAPGGGAAPPQPAIPDRDYRTVGLLEAFDSETDRDDPDNFWVKTGEARDQTAYLAGDEVDPYRLTFDDQGRAWQNGRLLDTTGSGAPLYSGSKAGRDIVVADEDGNLVSADMRAEWARRRGDRERFHHSSLVDGEDVSGAGEIQARDGVVEVISDRSGHYRPDMGLTGQLVTSLEDRGVTIEGVGVELGDKDGMPGGDIQASAIEVQAYGQVSDAELARGDRRRGGSVPDDRTDWSRVGDDDLDEDEEDAAMDARERGVRSERLLRDRHAQKGGMLNELLDATRGRRVAADEGVEAGELLPEAPPDFSTIGPINRAAVAGMVARGSADTRTSFTASNGTVLFGEGHDFDVVRYLGGSAAQGFVTFKRNRMSANEFVVDQRRGELVSLEDIRTEIVRHINDDSVYDYGDVSRVKVHF